MPRDPFGKKLVTARVSVFLWEVEHRHDCNISFKQIGARCSRKVRLSVLSLILSIRTLYALKHDLSTKTFLTFCLLRTGESSPAHFSTQN